jgi:hypothetical protein
VPLRAAAGARVTQTSAAHENVVILARAEVPALPAMLVILLVDLQRL